MLDKIRERLEQIRRRNQRIEDEMQEAATQGDARRVVELQVGRKRTALLAELYREWERLQEAIAGARAVSEEDPSLGDLATAEIRELEARAAEIEGRILDHMGGDAEADEKNVFLEIRAAAGGDEAGLFAGDLLRMYERFCEQKGWAFEIANASPGTHGGYKEVVARISGKDAYGNLKFESGGHRVQRVPETESQGRIHTSVCTVAVIPEAKMEDVRIEPDDLKIETFRSSGAGGQHVNKTDSAVRVTHLPTATVVECQSDRSQHRNKQMAMAVLRARIQDRIEQQSQSQEAKLRKSQVGTGERSEKIRTYNFPQGRITDHRIKLTMHKLDDMLEGNLGELVTELRKSRAIESALEQTEADAHA